MCSWRDVQGALVARDGREASCGIGIWQWGNGLPRMVTVADNHVNVAVDARGVGTSSGWVRSNSVHQLMSPYRGRKLRIVP
jgi:hypothetical protein